MALSTVDRVRLESMLGLLGSDHPGERENAASLIEQFRKQRGLSWSDLLVRQLGGFAAAAGQPTTIPGVDYVHRRHRPRRYRRHDTAWRLSMLIGLIVIGFVSLTSALEIHKIEQAASVRPAWGLGSVIKNDSAAAVTTRQAPATTLPAATGTATPVAFTEGVTDRKLSDNWRKSDAPRLCAGHLRNDQEELKSACAAAANLLRQFSQRRHTDREVSARLG